MARSHPKVLGIVGGLSWVRDGERTRVGATVDIYSIEQASEISGVVGRAERETYSPWCGQRHETSRERESRRDLPKHQCIATRVRRGCRKSGTDYYSSQNAEQQV